MWRPGTGDADQPQRHADAARQLHLHQHRPHRRRRRVVGGHDRRAARPPDRLDAARTGRPSSATPAAHPNARFTAPAAQDPAIAPEWEDPAGVPISAILFGGRAARWSRSSPSPSTGRTACSWARSWRRRRPPPPPAPSATLRRDPFAMLPFCGYNMADYFAHWLRIGEPPTPTKLPKHLLRQLVPQGRRRPLPVAGLRRELPRARVGRSSAAAGAARPRRHRSATCPRRARSTPTGSR